MSSWLKNVAGFISKPGSSQRTPSTEKTRSSSPAIPTAGGARPPTPTSVSRSRTPTSQGRTERSNSFSEIPPPPEAEYMEPMFESFIEEMGLKPERAATLRSLPLEHKWKLLYQHYMVTVSKKIEEASGESKDTPEYQQKLIKSEPTTDNLATLRVVLQSASTSWVGKFVELKGIDLLYEILSNNTDEEVRISAFRCLRAMMNFQEGLNAVLKYEQSFSIVIRHIRLSLNEVFMELGFEHLMVGCRLSPENYSRVLEDFAKASIGEPRFVCVISSLSRFPSFAFRVSCLTFINTIISEAPSESERRELRQEFLQGGLGSAIQLIEEDMVKEENRENRYTADLQTQVGVFKDLWEMDKNVEEKQNLLTTVSQRMLGTKAYKLFEQVLKRWLKMSFEQLEVELDYILKDLVGASPAQLKKALEEAKAAMESTPKSPGSSGPASGDSQSKAPVRPVIRAAPHRSNEVRQSQSLGTLPSLASNEQPIAEKTDNTASAPAPPPPPPPPPPAPAMSGAPPPPPPPPPGMMGGPPPPPPPPGMMGGPPPPPPPPGMMGGPPPPPPPPGMMGGPPPPPGMPSGPAAPLASAKSAKYVGKPQMPMKPMHWTKFPPMVAAKTVWKGLSDHNVNLEVESVMNVFRAKAPATPASSAPKEAPKKQIVNLLDSKRSNNANIVIQHIKLDANTIRDTLISMEEGILTEENIKGLIDISPTEEEHKALTSYTGSVENLGKAEQFLLQIISIPLVTLRLNAYYFRLTAPDKIAELRQSVEIMTKACNEAKNSKQFFRILEITLAIGNFMNGGTNRGNCLGFKLTYISELSKIKGVDNKTTVLSYIASVIFKELIDSEKYPSTPLNQLNKQLLHIPLASKIPVAQLQTDVSAMQKQVQEMRVKIEQLKENTSSPASTGPFVKTMEDFLLTVSGKMQNVLEGYSDMMDSLKGFLAHIGEDSDVAEEKLFSSADEHIALLSKFMDDWEQVCRPIEAQYQPVKKEKNTNVTKSEKPKEVTHGAELPSGVEGRLLESLLVDLKDGKYFKNRMRQEQQKNDA